MRYFPTVLFCFCVLGLVTLAVSQSEEENNVITSDFGRRVITNVRGGNRRRSIMTENPLLAVQDKNIKEPADQMALEQQYYIEPVTPTTSTVKPTFRRRKTQRPITSLAQQKKKEGPSDGNNNDGNANPQEHFNPFKQVVNTSFSKRRPSGGRPRARAQTNEISSTTEGQEQKSKIRFSVSQEIDHDNEGNNPSAFGLRGQAFRGDAAEDKPRFRPSQQGKSNFRPNRVQTTTRRTFPNGNQQSEKSPLEITYENETTGAANQNAGRRKFILRPRQQSTSRPSGLSPATTSETPARSQRKRKRPSFLHDSENLESNVPAVIAAPEENIPRARSIDGGHRRRKTTSFTPPTQRFSASEVVINAELLPSPSPFVLVSVSPLNSENKNQLRRRQQKPNLKPVTGDYDFLKTTTGFTTDSSATISTFPTTVVTEIENVIIADSEPIIILPPVSSTVKPGRQIKHIPGRDRINERLRFSRDRSVNPTPGIPAVQASASTTVQVVSPSPQAPLEVGQSPEGAKPNVLPTRQSLFDKLNRKQATLKLLSPKPKLEKPVEQVNVVETKKNAPPRKITSLTQQNLRKRVPGSGGLLNRKLQKEIVSENPPQEGENTSSEVSEEQAEKNVAENPPAVASPSPPVGIRNLTNRRRPLAMKQTLVSPAPASSPVKENSNETQDAAVPHQNAEGESDGQHADTPVAHPLLSKARKIPTRAPLLHRLVITTAAPPPPAEETSNVTCAANQRYSKFLKRCVTQYNPAKNLGGLH